MPAQRVSALQALARPEQQPDEEQRAHWLRAPEPELWVRPADAEHAQPAQRAVSQRAPEREDAQPEWWPALRDARVSAPPELFARQRVQLCPPDARELLWRRLRALPFLFARRLRRRLPLPPGR